MTRKRRTSESAVLNIFFPCAAIRVCIMYLEFIKSPETTLQREDTKGTEYLCFSYVKQNLTLVQKVGGLTPNWTLKYLNPKPDGR